MKRARQATIGHLGAGVALAALSGILLFLALPPLPLGFLAWIAFVPGLWAQFLLAPTDRAARLYMAVTYVLGVGLTVLWNIPTDVVPAPVALHVPIGGAILVVGVVVFLLALPTGLPSFHRRTRFQFFILGPALAWVGFEFLRMLVQLGHVWGGLATSQADNLPMMQLAALGGPWLLSLLIVAANYALGLLGIVLFSSQERGIAGRPAWVSLLVVALIVAGAFAWGAVRCVERPGAIRVAAIQPGEELGDVFAYLQRWANRDWEGLSRDIIPDMAARTRQAADQGARLVVWPEATLWLDPLDPDNDPFTREQLAELARETGVTLVIPYYILPPEGYLSWWLGFVPGQRNETLVVTPKGQFLGPYAKNHPIPYIGEVSSTRGRYPVHVLPFARVATASRYQAVSGNAARRLAGGGTQLLSFSTRDWTAVSSTCGVHARLQAAKNGSVVITHIATMLGYDTAFTDTARRLARGEAKILSLSTHDWTAMSGTYGVHTRLRAVENGVAIVKSDWEVGSLIVDPWGRLLAAAPTDRTEEMILVADVPLLDGTTLYTTLGDVLGYISLAGMVIFLLVVPFVQRRFWRRRLGGG